MASYESRYPVYYRGTANIGGNLSVAKHEHIARSGSKKTPRASIRKKSSAQTDMKKSATQTTSRRRSNIIASLALTGLGVGSLWVVSKFCLQSEPIKAGAEAATAYVSIPQTPAKKTKGEAPVAHDEVLEAQRVVNTSMTDAERRAKPFVDRMLGNPEMMDLIYSVSATTNTPVPMLMEVIAAETGGRPDNPLQVTPLQFPQLLGTYGHTYAAKMTSYAATLPNDKARLIQAQAAELQFIIPFIKYKEDHIHFEIRSDLYKDYMHKILGKKATFPSLEQRVQALYQTEYIRTGMQALSNNADRTTIMGLLGNRDPRKIFGTDAISRLINYFGITRVKRFSEIGDRDGLPVIGNLMDEATARANHLDYHIKAEKVTIKSHDHVKYIVKETRIPITIGELKQTQLKPWDRIQEGIRQLLTRNRAQRLLMSRGL